MSLAAHKNTSKPDFVTLAYQRGAEYLDQVNEEEKKEAGQFLTPPQIANYLASELFPFESSSVTLLDPSVGSGVLVAAVIRKAIENGYPNKIFIEAYETDKNLCQLCDRVLAEIKQNLTGLDFEFGWEIHNSDFILSRAPTKTQDLFEQKNPNDKAVSNFDAVIANPPYFKLNRDDSRVQAVEGVIEGHTNIYTLFMGVSARLLKEKTGRASFIVPRSFCSGAYFQKFRKQFLNFAKPQHIHLFRSRDTAFGQDSVLQENIIFTFEEGHSKHLDSVSISTSSGVSDLTSDVATRQREITRQEFLWQEEGAQYFRLPSFDLDRRVLSVVDDWPNTFESLGLEVSTGPVVAFRCKEHLTDAHQVKKGKAVPLLWMTHLSPGAVQWPKQDYGRCQAILNSASSESLLLEAENSVLVRRFSSKDDKRRLTAAPLIADEICHQKIGLENHVNYLHCPNKEMPASVSRGLSVLLNSPLIDRYFRILNGNTQVNAGDLASIRLPTIETLKYLGEKVETDRLAASGDELIPVLRESNDLPDEMPSFTETRFKMGKIQEAKDILSSVGFPDDYESEQPPLTLLVLAQISESDSWEDADRNLLGISEMIQEMRELYDRKYKENTRESIRKEVIHYFQQHAIVERNPDDPSRPTNSPNTNYALTPAMLKVVRAYNSENWPEAAKTFLQEQTSLIEKYKRKRDQEKIPLKLSTGEEYELSPGDHNQLQKQVIKEFAERFAPGSTILYLGDTANKKLHLAEEEFDKLQIPVPDHDKLPDVILYDEKEERLYLIEAVTSRGPISRKREAEIRELMLSNTDVEAIFVSAFPNFSKFKEFLSDIAWETEVWIAKNPGHLIHYNGDSFLD